MNDPSWKDAAMRLNVSLEDISDGKLYDINDMVKADTRGCDGCSACCHNNEQFICLNPFDMYQIQTYTNLSYDQLIDQQIELHDEEKIALPNLKMIGEAQACGFLDADERCSIHEARPSICRIFPLGRYYDNNDFKYIFQTGECIKPNLSKVKVKKWIDIDNYKANKAMILAWHGLLKALKWRVKFVRDAQELEEMNTYLIHTFYIDVCPKGEDFYESFYGKLTIAKDHLGVL